MKITDLLIWGGSIAGIGAFGYKMVRKSQGKEVKPMTETIMYAGVGAMAIGVATNVAMGKKAPVKVS